jgi:hypothetical protein
MDGGSTDRAGTVIGPRAIHLTATETVAPSILRFAFRSNDSALPEAHAIVNNAEPLACIPVRRPYTTHAEPGT